MSGSDIRWAVCKSASRSRQITMPVPQHSSFFTGRMPFLPPNQQRQSTEGTRRYASAIYMLSVCLSVCLSQTGIVSKRLYESSWVLARARSVPSTCPTLCYKEIWLSSKIRVLASGTLSQTTDFENFATASRSR